jgi:hypothetical protein
MHCSRSEKGRKTLDEIRAETRARVAKHRAAKKAADVTEKDSVTLDLPSVSAETPIAPVAPTWEEWIEAHPGSTMAAWPGYEARNAAMAAEYRRQPSKNPEPQTIPIGRGIPHSLNLSRLKTTNQ